MGRHDPIEVDEARTVFEQIEALIGPELAARISEKFGGGRLYVPASCKPNHPLAVVVGHGPAETLCAAIGRQWVEAPLNLHKRRRIVELLKTGEKPERIARRLNCSRRWVFKVKAALDGGQEANPDQLKLL